MSSTIHLCVSITESWSHWWPKLRDWAGRPVGAGWYSWAALSLINSKTLYMSQAYSVPTNLKYYTVHKKPSCSKTYQTYQGSVTTPSKSFLFPNVNWRITFKSSLLIYLPSPSSSPLCRTRDDLRTAKLPFPLIFRPNAERRRHKKTHRTTFLDAAFTFPYSVRFCKHAFLIFRQHPIICNLHINKRKQVNYLKFS